MKKTAVNITLVELGKLPFFWTTPPQTRGRCKFTHQCQYYDEKDRSYLPWKQFPFHLRELRCRAQRQRRSLKWKKAWFAPVQPMMWTIPTPMGPQEQFRPKHDQFCMLSQGIGLPTTQAPSKERKIVMVMARFCDVPKIGDGKNRKYTTIVW